MHCLMPRIFLCVEFATAALFCLTACSSPRTSFAAEPKPESNAIDFSTQVQPILSDRCFHCHGPDSENQDSAFRADTKDNLFANLGSYTAVVPGDLEASELHRRIHSSDPNEVMPPPDSNRALSDEDKRILDQWIIEGASYASHWSFTPPTRPNVPADVLTQLANDKDWKQVDLSRWSENPIDAFIAKRLQAAGLAATAEADPETLLRRASLTLTGLLPPTKLRSEFLANPTNATYIAAVEVLLNSMAYAERQSLRWLDAARYADTDGYQNDRERTNWPWRDWVTKAFHDNKPFDEFTIEQLAGDMLPGATESQRLATAFNRNHRQNGEAGALADEFSVENVIDRVETTATVWLGLTAGCARCHDHKYDPLSQREFYQLYAYFNNIGERGIGNGIDAMPTIETYSPLVTIPPKLVTGLADAERALSESRKSLDARMNDWAIATRGQLDADTSLDDWKIADIRSHELIGEGRLERLDDLTLEYTGTSPKSVTYEIGLNVGGQTLSSLMIEALPDDKFGKPRQLAPSSNGNFVMTELLVLFNEKPVALASIVASFEQDSYAVANAIDNDAKSGWAVFGSEVQPEPVQAIVQFAEPISVAANDRVEVKLVFGSEFAGHSIGKLQLKTTDTPNASLPKSFGLSENIFNALRQPADQRNDKQNELLRAHFETIDEVTVSAKSAVANAEREMNERGFRKATVMVMNERDGDPTPSYLLQRGAYDAPDKSSSIPRGVPVSLLASADTPQPSDRMELAKWLVSSQNPLTARVIVNRIWQDHFGTGLVKTTEDFGLQGETPSHRELLDWLAVEFMESGWDVQAMHRLIVTSQTYRQSSKTTSEKTSKDPENRLLARGPRYRADGFTIRDVSLQASGLLSEKVGGPSVKPYQPDGLWSVVAANLGMDYDMDKGDALFRKSVYTYWKRAVNPPRQTIFDSGGREVCNVRVRRTNTPLQALVMMNDPTFIEAARNLAQRALLDQSLDTTQRLEFIYEEAVARSASKQVMDVLTKNVEFYREHYSKKPDDAASLVATGESPRNETLDVTEHAALTATAHLIFNLDEFITVE